MIKWQCAYCIDKSEIWASRSFVIPICFKGDRSFHRVSQYKAANIFKLSVSYVKNTETQTIFKSYSLFADMNKVIIYLFFFVLLSAAANAQNTVVRSAVTFKTKNLGI